MKAYVLALAAVTLGTGALAEAPKVERNQMVVSADGTNLGRIDRVVTGSDGTPTAVRLIFRGKSLTIPVQTLSEGEKGLKTSLTNAELNKQ